MLLSVTTAKSHLIAAAIRKVHEAKHTGEATVTVWGDGNTRREFTFVSDLAEWITSDTVEHEAEHAIRIREWRAERGI